MIEDGSFETGLENDFLPLKITFGEDRVTGR
jgi:hypothetical protein